MNKMNIFITGINGFIGSNLARFLLEKGHTVSGSVRTAGNLSSLSGLKSRLVTGDISDSRFLDSCFKNQDIVYHVAAYASDWGKKSQFISVNVEGTKNVAHAALKNNVRRLVYISSTAVYGITGFRDCTEVSSYNCDGSFYAVSKIRAEQWLRDFAQEHNISIVIVQPANVFGPGDKKFFLTFARALEKGTLSFIENGAALTCPTYVENLAGALWLVGTNPKANGETFIISDGLEINWRQFIEKICSNLNIKTPRRSVSYSFAFRLASAFEMVYKICGSPNAPPFTRYRIRNFGLDYHFSIDKIRNVLGYSPSISIDEAIHRTSLWYRQYLKEKKNAC